MVQQMLNIAKDKWNERKQLEELILLHCCNNPDNDIDRTAEIKIDEFIDDFLSKFKLLTIPVVLNSTDLK